MEGTVGTQTVLYIDKHFRSHNKFKLPILLGRMLTVFHAEIIVIDATSSFGIWMCGQRLIYLLKKPNEIGRSNNVNILGDPGLRGMKRNGEADDLGRQGSKGNRFLSSLQPV